MGFVNGKQEQDKEQGSELRYDINMDLIRKAILIGLLLKTMSCMPINEYALQHTSTPPSLPTATVPAPYTYYTPTPGYPEEGFGPFNFPTHVNPLTGLSADPKFLDRRPIIIKVSNLPREVRPQSGLSQADMIYEYYTEEGTTRFAALYYSRDAEQVGSIRSARFFDEHLVRMYSAWFVFGSGDERVRERLWDSGFANRLIVEWEAACPALCRPDPITNYLFGNTIAIRDYIRQRGVPDKRQNLEGTRFRLIAPQGGDPAVRLFVWYSAAIYNRWNYDSESGRYLRASDVENALDGMPEVYAPLTDALTNEPIAVENVVILLMEHSFFSLSPEIVEMAFTGTGLAYAFRDGQAYALKWTRSDENSVVTLTTEDGAPFPFKPGVTWFEVMGVNTIIEKEKRTWRFEMRFP